MLTERVLEIVLDSFPKILIPGLVATIPLTAIAFSCALLIAICTSLIRFAEVKILKDVVRL